MVRQENGDAEKSLRKLTGRSLSDAEVRKQVEQLIKNDVDSLQKRGKKAGPNLGVAESYIRSQRSLVGKIQGEDVLTKEDIDFLFKRRCGNYGIGRRTVPMNITESLFSESEAGWTGVDELTVELEINDIVPSGLTKSDVVEASRSAIQTWHNANIGIGVLESSFNPMVKLKFVYRDHDDHRATTLQMIAHGDFPPPNSLYVSTPPLPICLYLDEFWGVDGSIGKFDVETVVLHELGHCIGLQHKGVGSIMNPYLPESANREIDPDTLDAARELYA